MTAPESPSRSRAHGDGTDAADTESGNISKALDNTFVHGLPGATPQCAVEFARYEPFLLEAKRVLRLSHPTTINILLVFHEIQLTK